MISLRLIRAAAIKPAFGCFNKMKISPSGFPGLLLVLLGGVGAYVLFGLQSFLIIMAIGLIAGTITAILIRRQTNKPEQHPLLLTKPDDAAEEKRVLDNEAAK